MRRMVMGWVSDFQVLSPSWVLALSRSGLSDLLAESVSILRLAVVSGRDHATVLTGSRQAIKHTIRGQAYFPDGFFSVALAAEIGGHRAEDVGAVRYEDDTGVVAHGFEGAGLVGDLQTFKK